MLAALAREGRRNRLGAVGRTGRPGSVALLRSATLPALSASVMLGADEKRSSSGRWKTWVTSAGSGCDSEIAPSITTSRSSGASLTGTLTAFSSQSPSGEDGDSSSFSNASSGGDKRPSMRGGTSSRGGASSPSDQDGKTDCLTGLGGAGGDSEGLFA